MHMGVPYEYTHMGRPIRIWANIRISSRTTINKTTVDIRQYRRNKRMHVIVYQTYVEVHLCVSNICRGKSLCSSYFISRSADALYV